MSPTGIAELRTKTFYQRWSAGIVVLTLLILPFAFYSAGRAVQSNVNRVEDWLPKSFDETRNLAWFRQHFASDQFIIISWEGCRLGSAAGGTQDDPRIAVLANLLVPGSLNDTEVADANVSQAPLPPEDEAARRRYFKTVVTGRHILDRLTNPPLNLTVDKAIGRLTGTMVGPDGQQTCIVVTLHDEAIAELKRVLGTGQRRIFRNNVPPGVLRRLIDLAGIPSADVHLGGPPVDNGAIDEEGERTLVRLAGLSGLLGLVLAWWSLRSVPLTAIVFFCGVMSAATSLAIVWLTGENVDAILMSMPSLVYVLAISGAVHLVNYYREAIQSAGLYSAAERAVQHAWKPAVLCSVTTAVGLLSLVASELVPIRKFGIYSAAGVMSLVAIVYFFLPAALQLTGIGKRWLPAGNINRSSATGNLPEPNSSTRIWEGIARYIVSHYRLVGLVCLAVTLVAGLGLRYTSSSIDLLKLFDHRARILQDYRWLEANLGKLVPLEIVVRFPLETQRENIATETDRGDWRALSFLERLETVTRMQGLIDRRFGPNGEDLVGRSMSAASFAPNLPAANSSNVGFIQRKALDARLSKSKHELSNAGFLKTDASDGSELWRISLRVAAFRDVDYGQFVKQLEQITQPLLDAYRTRAQILIELARLVPENSPAGKRVLLWSYRDEQSPKETLETFQLVLHRLLHEYKCEIEVVTGNPKSTPLSELETRNDLDAVVVFGDFTDSDLELLRIGIPRLIDARLQKLDAPVSQLSHLKMPEDNELKAIYTGVIPIVYQAQRALLESLVNSTWWSFLTITPIMMLVSRSFSAGIIAMLPNALPVLLIFGGMGWMGIPIDIGSMMTASIALGVAVDDTIHFLARYRVELDHCSSRNAAIVSTYGHCAVPTLQAALISGLGLSVFAFSTFTPTQRFGWLMLCILMAGVVSELVLLPALLASPLGIVFGASRSPRFSLRGMFRWLRFESAHRQVADFHAERRSRIGRKVV